MNFKNNAISPADHYTFLNFLPSVFDLQFLFLLLSNKNKFGGLFTKLMNTVSVPHKL